MRIPGRKGGEKVPSQHHSSGDLFHEAVAHSPDRPPHIFGQWCNLRGEYIRDIRVTLDRHTDELLACAACGSVTKNREHHTHRTSVSPRKICNRGSEIADLGLLHRRIEDESAMQAPRYCVGDNPPRAGGLTRLFKKLEQNSDLQEPPHLTSRPPRNKLPSSHPLERRLRPRNHDAPDNGKTGDLLLMFDDIYIREPTG